MKAPGTKHLTLEYDKLLSNVAFKFKLRRYSKELIENLTVLRFSNIIFQPLW